MNHKPGSVPAFQLVTAIYLESALRPTFAQSTRSIGRAALLLLDFAPDEVCRNRYCCQYRGGPLPHPFTLTQHQTPGGLLSVALSVPRCRI